MLICSRTNIVKIGDNSKTITGVLCELVAFIWSRFVISPRTTQDMIEILLRLYLARGGISGRGWSFSSNVEFEVSFHCQETIECENNKIFIETLLNTGIIKLVIMVALLKRFPCYTFSIALFIIVVYNPLAVIKTSASLWCLNVMNLGVVLTVK